ncbi:MAG: extracellular solute-binding protein [Erysipelotrichaceae bacterium]|nr:extracellular solute-binding protein [Erysipelotrichaceae bacterium]
MKKFLVVLMSILMVVSMAACGPKTPEKESYSFKVWCADKIVDLTKSQLDKFAADHPEYNLTFTVEAVGEGDAATSMITDVEAGGDVYCFAQDQLARLVQSNALAKPGQQASATIKEANDAGSVAAATFSGELYAYPLTSDNGYFMYYDKTVVKEEHIDDLTAILADCEAAGKLFSFEGTTSAWYEAGMFFATGCVSEWVMNGTDIVSYNDTFNSDAGLIAAKGLKEIVNSKAFNSSSSAAEFMSGSAVVISGTWDYETAVQALGDNLGVADLPSFTVDGKSYHMGSFGGNKLVGVKPQTDAKKAAVASQIALWLTGAQCQTERFEAVAWGPSNKEAASSDAVKANPALVAFAAQNDYAVPQGQYPGAWWDIGKAIGAGIKELGPNATDEQLKGVLQIYADSLAALLTVDPAEARKWTVIGGILGDSWTQDVAMTEDPAGTWKTDVLELHAGEEFKVRRGASWDFNLGSTGPGGDNFKVEEDGKYIIVLTMDNDDAWESGKVELIKQ